MDRFTNITGGEGLNQYYQSVCQECGWIGLEHYAHNDYQMTNLNEERVEHLKHCSSEEKE